MDKTPKNLVKELYQEKSALHASHKSVVQSIAKGQSTGKNFDEQVLERDKHLDRVKEIRNTLRTNEQ